MFSAIIVNIKSIWQPNMIKPESICPYTSSHLRWELPEHQDIAIEVTSTTKPSKPYTQIITQRVQSELGSPINNWHPFSSINPFI
jgi:hypothetical protein